MKKQNKYRIEYLVQGNYGYGHGWEDENTELTAKDGNRSFREYLANGSGCYRLIKRRVLNEQPVEA